MEGKCTAHKKAQSWAGAKVSWGLNYGGVRGLQGSVSLSDMEQCKVLGQRECYAETRICGRIIRKAWRGGTVFEIAKAPHSPIVEDPRGTVLSLSQTFQGLPSDTSGPAYLALVTF